MSENNGFLDPSKRPKKHGLYDPQFEKDSCGVGFVANIKKRASHQIIRDADHILRRMDHRGGCGCESNTGDGAGILTALPDLFLRRVAKQDLGLDLPELGHYAAGNVFLPQNAQEREQCQRVFEKIIQEEGLVCLGWRELPVDNTSADLGPTARKAQPAIAQLFVAVGKETKNHDFERKLFVVRKRATHKLRTNPELREAHMFYVCSLSTKIIIYKGMLTPAQVTLFYVDLNAQDYESHLAMVHSRFSTNTFPSWDRAQPNRFMSHNGEINTLRGNMNWMRAREGTMSSALYGKDIEKLFPICEPDCSDSGNFDNVLEFLLMSGRSLQEAISMMIPEAWQANDNMDASKKAFYKYHSALMEPWDGPASIAFTDGRYIGAVLDRNGLRPSRYYLTHDDMVVMASEVGVLDIDPKNIKFKGRLQPGKMFLIDFEHGRMIPDEELKKEFSNRHPYADWLKDQVIELDSLRPNKEPHGFHPESLPQRMKAFGYTTESMQFMLLPLVKELRDPVGSMGNDAALACLSDKPRMIFDYFKQLFAQVTNPPIDSIREEVVMSLECFIGPERNLLETRAEHAHRLRVPHPILRNEELAALKHISVQGWRATTIDITYPVNDNAADLIKALDRVCTAATHAIDEGYSLIILSDRNMGPHRIAVSSLLATGAVHHHLVKLHKRTRIGIILETGEAREVHHHCLLMGYGADAINPYLAFESLWQAQRDGLLPGAKYEQDENIVTAYRKGVLKGMLKVMAKMGISTLQSYKGAQIFEAVGIASEVIDKCFMDTSSRIQGVGFKVLAQEAHRRHTVGYPARSREFSNQLSNSGEFHWRAGGEAHMWNPKTISDLQVAARTNSRDAYKRFAEFVNTQATRECTLRGLLNFKVTDKAIPLDEVEPAKEIVKRFCTGAMSFGSISKDAHESLAIAMNRIGGKSNTGEGGEDAQRFKTLPNGDSKRSAIKQVASGRFGVTIDYLTHATELQIKIAQGAKPGEGGELPGKKVDKTIARIRHSTPGVGLISPPPHHDIYSIEDIAQLIHDLKNANPSARISVKLVSEIGVGTIAAGVTKAKTDHIVISGHDGGTGASPLTSIKHAGLPWELGVAETHQTLVMNDLRSRVVVQTDGQLKTGRDVVIAALLGAEEIGFSTAPLITMGCIMMRKCHLNTCPVGIATQDPELTKKFTGKPEHVINYLFMVAEDVREIMATLGFRKFTNMIGRVDALETNKAIQHWKADGLDLTPLLTPALKPHKDVGVYQTRKQEHLLEQALDQQLIVAALPALDRREPVRINLPIINTNRVVGTMLSHEIAKRYHLKDDPAIKPLAEDTIHIKFTGSAGQSLGAFLAPGVTIELEGDANDYVGKGLSGGKLIIYPPRSANFKAEENILVGNVVLYGATSGEAYFRGIAAERFCVRNSGANAVIEGVGDHGCEYMTGGRVVVLGDTGRNFAAGMSGGVAYVWNKKGIFASLCNTDMVAVEALESGEDKSELRQLIQKHFDYTASTVAQTILENWEQSLGQFVKVMPVDYKRALAELKQQPRTAVAV